MKRPIVNLFMVIMIVVSLIASGLPVTSVEALGAMADVPLTLPGGWSNAHLYDIWGSSGSNIYLVGADDISSPSRPLIYHYAGSNWDPITPPLPSGWSSALLRGVWGYSGTVYAVGSGRMTAGGNDLPLLYSTTDGTNWSPTILDLPPDWTKGSFEAVWGSGPNDVYAVGTGDTGSTKKALIYHYTAAGWSYTIPYPDLATVSLHGVWGSSATDVYAVGDVGDAPLMLHGSGTSWTRISVGLPLNWTTGSLNGVWGASAGEIYVAGNGNNGTKIAPLLLRGVGTPPAPLTWATYAPSLPSSAWNYGRLYDVWGNSGKVYAVGSGYNGSTDVPMLYRRTSTGGWSLSIPLLSGWSQAGYQGIWGITSDDVYAVGDGKNPAVPFLSHAGPAPDTIAPGAVANLTAVPGAGNGSVRLSWNAPADDDGNNTSGAADHYKIIYSESTLVDCSSGTEASNPPLPAVPTTTQTMTISGLTLGTLYNFSVCTWDEAGNPIGPPSGAFATPVSATPQTLPGEGIWDDTDPGWTYSSGYLTFSDSHAYGGSSHYSGTVGKYAEFTFVGSQFSLIYSAFSNRGTLDVYIDGSPTKLTTINEYNATRIWQARWTSGNLGAGQHTVRLVHASGLYVDIDAIQIANFPVVGKYDDTDPNWTYSSGYLTYTDSNAYGGSAHYSGTVGKYAEFTFVGSQFSLIYSAFSNRGTLDVYIDGSPTKAATINEYNATRIWQAQWTSGNLGAGQHTVRLVHASGLYVDIDAIEIKNYQAPGLGKYDDTSGWIYSSGYLTYTDSNAYGGSAHYSDTVGKYAEFTFEGPQFVLIYSAFSNRGTLDVYIDGSPTKAATINEYNATRLWQAEWASSNLGAGQHTVRLVHASGLYVDIDAIQIRAYQPPGLGKYDDTFGWLYSSGYLTYADSNTYGGSAHYSDTVGKYAEFTFVGSQFVLIYSAFSNRGTLDVYIDGSPTKLTTINEYNATRIWQARWISGNLGAGQHTVKLVHASGMFVDVDAIEIRDFSGAGTYDDTHSNWTYSSGYLTYTDSNAYGGSAHYSDTVGKFAEFTFVGSQFSLIYSAFSNRGTLDVYIDGSPTKAATINEYNATRIWQAQWTSGNLGAGGHTVRLVHASGLYVDVDAIQIGNYTAPGSGTWDDTNSGWIYSSGYLTYSDSNAYGGSAHYSDTVGKYAEFTFVGSQFVLIYTGFSNRGTVDVYIDGSPTKFATFSEYSATKVWQSTWPSGSLGASTQHTVRLVHASGAYVDIDAIQVIP